MNNCSKTNIVANLALTPFLLSFPFVFLHIFLFFYSTKYQSSFVKLFYTHVCLLWHYYFSFFFFFFHTHKHTYTHSRAYTIINVDFLISSSVQFSIFQLSHPLCFHINSFLSFSCVSLTSELIFIFQLLSMFN